MTDQGTTARVLISPLGRSPGAVSGVYFALVKRKLPVQKVVTVGTSHTAVLAAARNYLEPLFKHLGVEYDPIHLPEEELKNERRIVIPYARMMGLELHEARENGAETHVAVTGGRSGMGALAALAAQFYGATNLWHLWVPTEIEKSGDVDALRALISPAQMAVSPYLNPTVWGEDAYSLVDLPFMDLSGLQDILLEYHRTGKLPDAGGALALAIQKAIRSDTEAIIPRLFPLQMSMEEAQEYLKLVSRYWQAKQSSERDVALLDLGQLFQRAGIVNAEERKKLMGLLQANGSVEDLLKLVKKDRTGLWGWLRENKDQLTVTIALADIFLKVIEIWLKLNGIIP